MRKVHDYNLFKLRVDGVKMDFFGYKLGHIIKIVWKYDKCMVSEIYQSLLKRRHFQLFSGEMDQVMDKAKIFINNMHFPHMNIFDSDNQK